MKPLEGHIYVTLQLLSSLFLQQFSGHASPVTRLLFTPYNLYPKETDSQEVTTSIEGLHFLSAAQNERVINVW